MQVFGGKFNYSGTSMKPRQNFDTFWQSLLTIFQVSQPYLRTWKIFEKVIYYRAEAEKLKWNFTKQKFQLRRLQYTIVCIGRLSEW